LTGNADIRDPKHYLIKSVVNRAINQKKLLRTRMEQYRGRWLPAPVITADSIYASADNDKLLEYSLMVLMEQLTPKERAVFILKETFDFSHEEIAEILNIKTDSSRQVLKRSKEKIHLPEHKSQVLDDNGRVMLENLAAAILGGDIEKAKLLLANDVKFMSDGGPTIAASRNIVIGPERVFKMLLAIYGKYFPEGAVTTLSEVNHNPAILFSIGGALFRAIVFTVTNNTITNVFVMLNPDKIQSRSNKTPR
jgi:RNA polymerase sigma-70 factor (ECF subfamily)